ncbi:MAG: exodeoxyribonuclease VII large subunit [Candidatus Berkelbacteria bacterium]
MKQLKISELNKLISNQVNNLVNLEVEGEISEWKMFGGKTFYFKLKDEKSSVSAMTNIFQLSNWRDFEEGMLVRTTISVKFNQSKGNLYAWVEEMAPSGEGALKIAIEKLKKRLLAEGLFSQERKRSLVRYPHKIGLITSRDGDAIKDFKKIINARAGGLEIFFYPVRVEGKDSVREITEAFTFFNNFKESLDAIVIIRGGGSIENLHAFNDEKTARCIAGSRFPVVCGVGHENDISLCDLCADVRASTPSNAAELLVEDQVYTVSIINTSISNIGKNIKIKIAGDIQYLSTINIPISSALKSAIGNKMSLIREISSTLQYFKSKFKNIEQQINQFVDSIKRIISYKFDLSNQSLRQTSAFLNSVSPKNIMSMGYSVVKDEKRQIIKSSGQLKLNSIINTYFYEGSIQAKVEKKEV